MKTSTKFLSLIIIALTTVSCFTKKGMIEPATVILPLGDTIKINDGSIVYGLPMTVFEIIVEVEKKIEKPGPYAKYAGEMLGIRDVITEDKETFSVTGIKVTSVEELDPSELYVIESNTLFQSNVLSLKKTGLILDLNPEVYRRPQEDRTDTRTMGAQHRLLDMGADEYFVTQNDTAFRLVNVDTAFIKIPYLVERKKQLSIEQLADKAAKTLLELRDGKHLILTGEANVYPQDKSAIDETNRLEDQYLALFAGKSWTEVSKYTFSIIPEKEMAVHPVTLFRFSEKTGVSKAEAASGNPVTVNLTPAQKTKEITIVSKPLAEKETAPKYDKLYYRVPSVVNLDVKIGAESLYSSRKLIYQFGDVFQLPANYIIGK